MWITCKKEVNKNGKLFITPQSTGFTHISTVLIPKISIDFQQISTTIKFTKKYGENKS